jgi:hypothetical protein
MISVKYSETDICIYSDYGCWDSSCPLNKLHKRVEATFGILDIEPPGCIKIMDMLFDESINSVVRNWIKASHHIKGEWYPLPQEIIDIIEGKKPKIFTPLERWMRGENVRVGPGVVIPNNREKPSIKNFFRHIWQHILSFLYKIQMRRHWKKIHAPVKLKPL